MIDINDYIIISNLKSVFFYCADLLLKNNNLSIKLGLNDSSSFRDYPKQTFSIFIDGEEFKTLSHYKKSIYYKDDLAECKIIEALFFKVPFMDDYETHPVTRFNKKTTQNVYYHYSEVLFLTPTNILASIEMFYGESVKVEYQQHFFKQQQKGIEKDKKNEKSEKIIQKYLELCENKKIRLSRDKKFLKACEIVEAEYLENNQKTKIKI